MLRILAFISALLISAPVAAVSCGKKQSVKQAYVAAQDIFSAHVEEIYQGHAFGRDNVHLARLRVLHVWKGSLNPGDMVSATAEDTVRFISDGFVPLQGSNVLLYSGGPEPYLLSTCSRSASLEFNRDIPALNRLSKRAERR